jgi:O-antigen ligase
VALSLHKNIGYITLAITGYVVLWMLEAEAPVGRPGRLRISKNLVFAMIVGLGAAVVIAARLEGAEPKFVPSGSVEVRSYVYRVLLHRFLDNPFIGDFYSSSALVELPYMEVLGNHHVTAHSDWLDALAHGGVIGGLLLFAATAWQLRHGPRPSLRRPLAFNRQARDFVEPSIERQRLIAGLWLIAVCGTVVSAFVSMLSALPIAFLFWSSIGFYVGIRLRD